MKKQIPEKIANKVYDKLLAGKRKERERNNWREKTVFKPGTTYLHNRFFKNSVGKYFRVSAKDERDIEDKQISTTRRTQSFLSKYNDYFQERPEHIRFNGKISSQSRKL